MVKYETVIGYSFDADDHCIDCTVERFGDSVDGSYPGFEDHEGNSIHAILAGYEGALAKHCGDCLEPLFN